MTISKVLHLWWFVFPSSFGFSSLAALGLIENNAPNITAAMLVSPLMGPVMSITFGAIISDRTLVVNIQKKNFFSLTIRLKYENFARFCGEKLNAKSMGCPKVLWLIVYNLICEVQTFDEIKMDTKKHWICCKLEVMSQSFAIHYGVLLILIFKCGLNGSDGIDVN